MNKTIIININGIVFHIEEDAYEVLKSYMTDVKRHFMNSEDSLEITTDIENRIAEMLNELLANENKQVIVEQDVKTVIEQMGTVADFEQSGQDTEATFENAYYNKESRRLFRDPDDHLAGGVCAGIANYFDIQVTWIRLAFAITFFFFGSGLFLYIILWMVIPRAVSRADRMAMKGQKLNLQGFKKNFEEELGSMRQNVSNFHHEARPFVYKARDFTGDFIDHLGDFLRGAMKIIVKLFGVAILMACFGWLIFFIVAFVALLSVGYFGPFRGLPYDILRHHHAHYIFSAAFVSVVIPLIAIIFLVLKGIFNIGGLNRSTGAAVLVVWLCAVGALVFNIVGVVSEFREYAGVVETVALTPSKNNTYHIKLNDLMYFTAEDSIKLNIKNLPPNVTVRDDDDNDFESFTHRNIRLNIETSDSGQPVLVKSFHARGPYFEDALANARNIKYVVAQQDSILKFDQRYYGKNNELWHGEEIELTLKLPMNAKVVIDHDVERIANFSIHDCNEVNKKDYDRVSDATFIMTNNGLQCKVDTMVMDTIIRRHLPTDSSKIKIK